jgi:3-isopropylmalate dehydrogenase
VAQFKIATLPGDGIGPDITEQAVKVLDAVGGKFGHSFAYTEALIGGAAIDATGSPLPDETLAVAQASDAVLLGAIGGPKWDTTDPKGVRPEQGLLGIRKALGLYANLRPVKVFDALVDTSTVKASVIRGVDIMIVRELTGGIYFGKRGREGDMAYDTETYHAFEVERIVRKACELARARGCGGRSPTRRSPTTRTSRCGTCSWTTARCSW